MFITGKLRRKDSSLAINIATYFQDNGYRSWCPNNIEVITKKGEKLTADFASELIKFTPWTAIKYQGIQPKI